MVIIDCSKLIHTTKVEKFIENLAEIIGCSDYLIETKPDFKVIDFPKLLREKPEYKVVMLVGEFENRPEELGLSNLENFLLCHGGIRVLRKNTTSNPRSVQYILEKIEELCDEDFSGLIRILTDKI